MVKEYHLSEKCLLLCACAETTLTDVCDRINDGSVTSSELSLIEKKKNHVLKLIGAVKDKDVAKSLEAATSEKGLIEMLRKSEMRVGEVLKQCEDAERRAQESEERVQQAERRARESEERVQQVLECVQQAERALKCVQQVETKAQELNIPVEQAEIRVEKEKEQNRARVRADEERLRKQQSDGT